jgi:hypothetical protein
MMPTLLNAASLSFAGPVVEISMVGTGYAPAKQLANWRFVSESGRGCTNNKKRCSPANSAPVFACEMRMKLGVALTNVGNATWKGSTFLIGHPRIRPKTEPWSITIEWPITEWKRRLNIRATKHVNGC